MGSGLCRAWESLWDECGMPQDCCHFPGPQPTPCLTVSLTLTLPPAPGEGPFPFGHHSSRWRLGGVLVHFPSATPKQSTLVFLSESVSSRISANVTGYAESSSQSGPCAFAVLCLWMLPSPTAPATSQIQLQHPAKSGRHLLTCSAS